MTLTLECSSVKFTHAYKRAISKENMATWIELSTYNPDIELWERERKWTQNNGKIDLNLKLQEVKRVESVLKVVILGDVLVGKSAFVERFVHNTFTFKARWNNPVSFASKDIEWSSRCLIKLQLWDISGHERYSSLTQVLYRGADACLVMFDLTRLSTLDTAVMWKRDLDRKCTLSDGSPVPCLLLANKSERLCERQVSQDEIVDFCERNNFIGWQEISVKDGTMMEETMQRLVGEMVSRNTEWNVVTSDLNS